MPGSGLLSERSPSVSQASVHTLCGLWYTGLCFSTHSACMDLTQANFSLALGSLSMDHLFLAPTAYWVGLAVRAGAISCFTSNSALPLTLLRLLWAVLPSSERAESCPWLQPPCMLPHRVAALLLYSSFSLPDEHGPETLYCYMKEG